MFFGWFLFLLDNNWIVMCWPADGAITSAFTSCDANFTFVQWLKNDIKYQPWWLYSEERLFHNRQFRSNVDHCVIVCFFSLPVLRIFNLLCYVSSTQANVHTYVIAWDSCGWSIWPCQVEFERGSSWLSGNSQNIRWLVPRHQQV